MLVHVNVNHDTTDQTKLTISISGLNATDKTPMYEMPLIYVFGGWGIWQWHFVIGVLSRDPTIRGEFMLQMSTLFF